MNATKTAKQNVANNADLARVKPFTNANIYRETAKVYNRDGRAAAARYFVTVMFRADLRTEKAEQYFPGVGLTFPADAE